MIDLKKDIAEQNYERVLQSLNALNISETSYDDFRSEATNLFETFLVCYNSLEASAISVAMKCLNLLKRSCARGETFQNIIISRDGFLERFRVILVDEKDTVTENIRASCLQLLGNLCVQNKANQENVIGKLHPFLLHSIVANDALANASAMLLYNGFIYKAGSVSLNTLLETLLTNVEMNRVLQQDLPEFVGIFLDYLISESNEMVDVLEGIEFSKKMLLYRYLIEYMRQEDRRIHPIHPDIFKHLLDQFKRQSDGVLKTENVQLDAPATEEVFTLLVYLSDASCIEPYSSFLRHDGALFLNLGCLLRQMQLLGKLGTENIFTPVQKIEEMLKIKQGTSEQNIEADISYSLRSAVVKALANMAYKSKKNQNLARDMDIMAAILDCTSLDARNPLIKEWSILAIHNLCEDNPENQQFISSLTKLAMAENSLLKECSAGTIRIGSDAQPYISRKK
ncbi:ataxin-10 [Anopheles cruzii]|uniref:ataxin-10 n=1 Tax=Anopheles cruzii TaxID=68878 RepID=UPI0022EC1DA0|nr:ataxin-10 [Anopheles cruzii]